MKSHLQSAFIEIDFLLKNTNTQNTTFSMDNTNDSSLHDQDGTLHLNMNTNSGTENDVGAVHNK
jgi:hypothetical protein